MQTSRDLVHTASAPAAVAALSVATGAAIAIGPRVPVAAAPGAAVAVVGACALASGLVRFGSRAIATACLFACAATVSLHDVRLASWMTASDLFLFAAGVLLLPEAHRLRLAPLHRGFLAAVGLIFAGGLVGTLAAAELRLSLLNVLRLVVASGATLIVFALWKPTAEQLTRFMSFVVLSSAITSGWALTHIGDVGRPSGLSQHPNHLALVCLVAIGPALALSLMPGRRRALRAAALVATTIIIGGVLVSGSRAGLVGMAASIAVTAVLLRDLRMRIRLWVGGAAVAGIAAVAFGGLTAENSLRRLLGEQRSSAASDRLRDVAFDEMMDDIRSSPVTGVGFAEPLRGHDAYLQLWAAGGLLAFAGGLVVVAVVVWAGRLLRRLPPPRTTADATLPLLASVASVTGLLVALAFQNLLWGRYLWVAIALVASAAAVAKANFRALPRPQ